MIIKLCILLPHVGLQTRSDYSGYVWWYGEACGDCQHANTFQASNPAFGLLCPAGAEKRPASQLHPTQGKPKHESSQHNYILQHNVHFNLLCIQHMFHNPPHGPLWLRNIVEGEHSNPVVLECSNISAPSAAAALSNLSPPTAVHSTPHSVEQPLPHAGNHLSVGVDTFLIRRTL